MKEYLIKPNEEGLTLHKYLQRVLPGAGSALLYKQLRKKNINLNHKKADGGERLKSGDSIQVFFSDETINKFSADEATALATDTNIVQKISTEKIKVLYEDTDILALDKPSGVLSQKAEKNDISLNEMMLQYLFDKNDISEASLKTVKPSVCNRLDRNTTGIVLCGKTMKGLKYLSEILKDRSVHKYYYCIVKGNVKKGASFEGYLTKSSSHNQVRISDAPVNENSQYICTEYKPVYTTEIVIPGDKDATKLSLLSVLLKTGRSHQIRAHLSSLGFPIIGDPKYGDIKLNKRIKRSFNVERQLLHAARVEMPDGKIIKSPLPEDMKWLPGIPVD